MAINPWMTHLNKFRKAHPKLSLTDCMKQAKKTYKKMPAKKKGAGKFKLAVEKQQGNGFLDYALEKNRPPPFIKKLGKGYNDFHASAPQPGQSGRVFQN